MTATAKPFTLTPEIVAAAQAHAIAEFPREACGVVVGRRYKPMPNTAAEPERDFRIAAAAYLAAGKVRCVIHSHTNGKTHPTQADMEGQLQTAVPWAVFACNGETCTAPVLWGDGAAVAPLLGRPFVPGVTDCYALVRDWFRQERGVALPEVPRDEEWWLHGANLYLDWFEKAGFRVIPQAEVRPGDGFLMRIRSPVPNHAGIVLENGLIVHHLQNRLSAREPMGAWIKLVTHWLRYEENARG